MRLTIRKRDSGFTLIEILISMGLVSVLAMVIFALNNFMNKGKSASDMSFQADQFRKEVIQMLNNPTAWRQTLIHNNTFQCIRTNSPDCNTGINQGPGAGVYTYTNINNTSTLGLCAAGTCYGGFDVYNPNGQPFYSATTATAGFTMSGAQCNTWAGTVVNGQLEGTSKCPFRLVLWWQPICPTNGNCPNPPVHVKGYTLYSPSHAQIPSQAAFNPGNYGIDLILPPTWQ